MRAEPASVHLGKGSGRVQKVVCGHGGSLWNSTWLPGRVSKSELGWPGLWEPRPGRAEDDLSYPCLKRRFCEESWFAEARLFKACFEKDPGKVAPVTAKCGLYYSRLKCCLQEASWEGVGHGDLQDDCLVRASEGLALWLLGRVGC